MRPFRLSTVVTLRIGPCLDSAGAEYTGLVIGDLTLTKAGTSAAMAAAATLTHIANGHYSLVTIVGNTDTIGSLRIDCNKATYQIPPVEGEVLPATVFDALVTNATTAAGGLGDIQRMSGTTLTGRDIGASVLLSSGTGTGQLSFTGGVVQADAARIGAVTQTGGDIFPAVTNIGVTSAALNKIADSRTITTGSSEANTYTSTAAADSTYHSISDTAGTIDFYYEATLPTTGGALTGVNWLGYVVGVVNTIKVYIYNWTNSGWDQVGSVVGIAGTASMDVDFDATNDHTGTGANALKVRVRFSATGLTTATVKTDRLLFGYTVVPTFPTNFSSMVIDSSGRIDLGKWIGTAPLALSSQQVQAIVPDAQKVDLNTIKTQAVTCSGGVTVPAATLASTTNITAGTITTVTTVTNQLTAAQIATGVWQDATAGDFTTASSIGKALYIANVAPGGSGGHLVSGSNAGTTTLGALTVTGNLTTGDLIINTVTFDARFPTNFSSMTVDGPTGYVLVDTRRWRGTDVSVPTVAGVPNVNTKTWNDLATVALPLVPTLAGRTLDVSAGGEAGLDWANIGTPGSTVSLSATTIATLTSAPSDSSGVTTLLTRVSGAVALSATLGTPAGASIAADIAAVQADSPNTITKNVALANFMFKMIDSSDHITAKTGLTVTATRSLDGAAFASCANSASEVSSGWYKINLAATDTNGTVVVLKFSASGADTTEVEILTQPT